MSENIFGIITRFGEDDFSYWEGFSLSEEEEKQIYHYDPTGPMAEHWQKILEYEKGNY